MLGTSHGANFHITHRVIKVDASSIVGAVAKAPREFVKGLERKQRFDANKGWQ
jgi:hypothetical protein